MPLTPFHVGPGLLVGLLLLRYMDLPTFLIASVIIDVEPILVVSLDLDYPLHGFLHSFLGGTFMALALAAVMSKVRASFSPLLLFFKLEQKSSFRSILSASLLGIYIHILLDSQMHMDIRPFYPLDFNPFLSRSTYPATWLEMLSMWCLIGAAIVYLVRLFLLWAETKMGHKLKAPFGTDAKNEAHRTLSASKRSDRSDFSWPPSTACLGDCLGGCRS